MKNLVHLLPFIFLSTLFFTCKNDDDGTTEPPPPPDLMVATVEINAPKVNFILGDDPPAQLTAEAQNAAGEMLDGKTFQWASSDEAVATVSSTGLLTLLGVGSAVVSATSEGVSGTLEIMVSEGPMPQVAIVANQAQFMFGALAAHQFQAVVVDAGGQVVADPQVEWGSLDETVVTVGSEGRITVLAIGETEVTATFEGVTASQPVTVGPPEGEGDFGYENDGVHLRATIDLPAGGGPFPAVVLVHGSGTATRETLQVFADILTNGGIAVLRYDKRGTGDSGGTFFEVGPSASGTQRIQQLGEDALAGLDFLRLHGQVEAEHVGLFGFSQGGWVVPSAAAGAAQVDFLVHIVGPTCTVGEEIYYSGLTAGGMSVEDANAQVANFSGTHGYDPIPDLEQIDRPALWVLGGQDASIPTAVTIERLELLIDAGKPFDIDLKPNGNHFLIDVNTGQQISYLSPPGGVIDWIMEVVN